MCFCHILNVQISFEQYLISFDELSLSCHIDSVANVEGRYLDQQLLTAGFLVQPRAELRCFPRVPTAGQNGHLLSLYWPATFIEDIKSCYPEVKASKSLNLECIKLPDSQTPLDRFKYQVHSGPLPQLKFGGSLGFAKCGSWSATLLKWSATRATFGKH